MDIRSTPLSSKLINSVVGCKYLVLIFFEGKDKLRNMEEELKKWREDKKRQSLVPKENQYESTFEQ